MPAVVVPLTAVMVLSDIAPDGAVVIVAGVRTGRVAVVIMGRVGAICVRTAHTV